MQIVGNQNLPTIFVVDNKVKVYSNGNKTTDKRRRTGYANCMATEGNCGKRCC
ncbi:hypothetical protein SD074_23480 [Prolixibacter sp. SD074]|nr:hypothetical protein SD074_23480 [Prolixibacter sp. SD074]